MKFSMLSREKKLRRAAFSQQRPFITGRGWKVEEKNYSICDKNDNRESNPIFLLLMHTAVDHKSLNTPLTYKLFVMKNLKFNISY